MNKIITAAPGFFSQNDAKKLAEQLESFREDVKDEAYFMTVAADMFEKALSEEADISESEKDNLSYLVGELRRRCGNPEQAEKWLKKTLGNTARSDLKKLIPVLLAHSESATGISTGVFPEITCPLCGKKTRYLKYSEPDYLGGKDTDFATYSLDPSTYCTEVICCLNCLYSNYRNGFHAALLPEQREALNAVLEPQRGRIAVTSPHGFKAWERYELVAKCFEALGKPSEQVGMVLVNGAWCARRALCSPTMEIDLVDGILYPKLAEEKAEALADGTFDGYYVAMLISHRAGLTEIRDSYLKKASKMTLDDPAREALMKSAKNIISQEERILREVVSKFEIVSEQVPFYRMYLFIMGDSYRRIGEERKAKKIYKRCADMTEVGEVAKKLLEQL